MKKEYNNTGLIALGLGFGAAILFGFRGIGQMQIGQPTGSNIGEAQDGTMKEAFSIVKSLYGRTFAEDIEQAIRWESAHFKSGQWKQGNSAGMWAFTNSFPYGWASLDEFTEDFPELELSASDFSTYEMRENATGEMHTFIRFPNAYTFILFMAWFIYNKRGGRVGRWNSLDEAKAAQYESKINTVTPSIVNSI